MQNMVKEFKNLVFQVFSFFNICKSNCLVGMMGSTSMVLKVPAAVDEGDGRVGVVGPFQSKGFMKGLEQWELIAMPGRHLVLISIYFWMVGTKMCNGSSWFFLYYV
ncbi:hypothetical protein ACSBR2_040254 [Camellia fascicularis]